MIKVGNENIIDVRLGGSPILKVMNGNNLIWERPYKSINFNNNNGGDYFHGNSPEWQFDYRNGGLNVPASYSRYQGGFDIHKYVNTDYIELEGYFYMPMYVKCLESGIYIENEHGRLRFCNNVDRERNFKIYLGNTEIGNIDYPTNISDWNVYYKITFSRGSRMIFDIWINRRQWSNTKENHKQIIIDLSNNNITNFLNTRINRFGYRVVGMRTDRNETTLLGTKIIF